jgi:uncharacterized membrane protein
MAESLFTEEDKKTIIEAIKKAELSTSGEIQVHIEMFCTESVLDRATEIFSILKMHKTALRNGVLIYLAVEDKKFAVIGDVGINNVVTDGFWNDIQNNMSERFKNHEFTLGLVESINKAAEQLKHHFPYQDDDINELPDEISFGAN